MKFGVCYGAFLLASWLGLGESNATEHAWLLALLLTLVGGATAGAIYSLKPCQSLPFRLILIVERLGWCMSEQEWSGFIAGAIAFFAFKLVSLKFEPTTLSAVKWVACNGLLSLGFGVIGSLIVHTIGPYHD